MNERIKELAKQAGLSYLYDYDADGHAMVCSEKDIKKFAELIVQECIVIVNKRKDAAIDADWLVDEAMSNAVWDIEEHFGVEK